MIVHHHPVDALFGDLQRLCDPGRFASRRRPGLVVPAELFVIVATVRLEHDHFGHPDYVLQVTDDGFGSFLVAAEPREDGRDQSVTRFGNLREDREAFPTRALVPKPLRVREIQDRRVPFRDVGEDPFVSVHAVKPMGDRPEYPPVELLTQPKQSWFSRGSKERLHHFILRCFLEFPPEVCHGSFGVRFQQVVPGKLFCGHAVGCTFPDLAFGVLFQLFPRGGRRRPVRVRVLARILVFITGCGFGREMLRDRLHLLFTHCGVLLLNIIYIKFKIV